MFRRILRNSLFCQCPQQLTPKTNPHVGLQVANEIQFKYFAFLELYTFLRLKY